MNCIYPCSWLPVHIMGSCSMQAMSCGGRHEIFSYTSTAGTLQEGSHAGKGWIWLKFVSIYIYMLHNIYIYTHDYLCTRKVSLRYRYGSRFGTGENLEKKEPFHNQRKHKWTIIAFQDIARYRFWYLAIWLSIVRSHFQEKRAFHIKTPSSTLLPVSHILRQYVKAL